MKLGKFIKKGKCRRVYEHPTDETKVIKVAHRPKRNHNSYEWEVWNKLKGTEYEKSIAPCHEISDCHKYLVMERAGKMTLHLKPPMMPEGFKDIKKRSNLGWIEGRVVIIDYANAGGFLG